MRTILTLAVLIGCGSEPIKPQVDARIDSNPIDATPPDAEVSSDLFGESCPIASVDFTAYLCHSDRGYCIAETDGNHCRPACGDTTGAYCASLGGKRYRVMAGLATVACVCVPV